ncbi:hypothetical protein [Holospora elegans]|uniref:hypothetical protein n=1 Tax=Holospora elegans TaxID=431043 RepID=UPI0019D32606|nr:hypothetical protein [Holospora elegans]
MRWSKTLEGGNKRNKPWTKLDKEKLRIDTEEFPDSLAMKGLRGEESALLVSDVQNNV